MEMIEATPAGLYEAVITDAGPDTANGRIPVDGKYLFRLEKRTLDDIRAFGVNSPEDDARFAALAWLSEINLSLYRTFWQPWVRAGVTEQTAEAMRAMHPNRLRFGLFSDQNPFTQAIKPLAEPFAPTGLRLVRTIRCLPWRRPPRRGSRPALKAGARSETA